MSVMIGIDPHKGSHAAVAVDTGEEALAEFEVQATRRQSGELLAWAERFPARRWAIESANGHGYLLAQQLIAAGEHVVDVPSTLSARVRVLDSTRSQKNDPNDARSVAIVALRQPGLRVVTAEDHVAVLRMLVKRHKQLSSLKTQSACRLHAVLATLIPGGLGKEMVVRQASQLLGRIRPATMVETERKNIARQLLGEVRRLETELKASKAQLQIAVEAAGTTLTDIYGVGPVVAGLLIGYTGDVSRFPTRHHYAAYNGTAPIEASSGQKKRHRLNPRGNRMLNHALHLIAITQLRYPNTEGRVFYERKLGEGKTKKEAIRALKRRLSDVVYRHLQTDQQPR
ncbi:MAG: IS110 family transposase [Acidimicrobiia bacterium]|nr:IS110 family transposase [Acidimicrobiia bacterium]MDH5615628.1 IS110 family transposase [Acidimicrobiia bacterium]